MALIFRGIAKSFGPVEVLRSVSFSVATGQVHALLGENGAGKSTLMKILLGAETADQGDILLGGVPHRPRSPKIAREAGVVMLPQERTLCGDLTVFENIVLAIEPTWGPFVRRAEARKVAARSLALVAGEDRRISLDALARALPTADQQLVEIARALAQGVRARVLVLDEPTSSLGKSDADRLFTRLRALKESGLAILLVTHFLSDVRAHADRYTVLRDGQVSGEGDPRETAAAQIVREMIGRELEEARRAPHDARPLGDVVLRQPGGFELRRGEILGIAGLVGSGRTELLHSVHRRGMGFSSEDRAGEGLMLGRSVADNITLSPRGPFFSLPRTILAEGARWIAELGIRARGPDQPVSELSGGNQQKVQIARLLREDFDILLVDEPTRGIDVASKAQILALVRELARKGKSIVLVSSELEDLVTTCDRIAILRRGELGPARAAADCTAETLLLEAAS